jgi:lysylphosphatidylglycerol synthetase-like protein (DUF2156 family)
VASWLREPPSRLIVIYAALVVLGYAVHALPGGLDYSRGIGELVFWLVVDAVLIFLIANGSRVAAAVILILNVGFLLAATIVSSASDLLHADLLAFVVVLLAQCVVLVRLVFRRRSPPVVPAG